MVKVVGDVVVVGSFNLDGLLVVGVKCVGVDMMV